MTRYIAYSRGIKKDPGVRVIFNQKVQSTLLPKSSDVIVGWGNKPSGKTAKEASEKFCTKYLCLEEGLYSYIAPKHAGGKRSSYMVSEDVPYYQTDVPSRLRRLLISQSISSEELLEAQRAIQIIRNCRLSKYPQHLECGESTSSWASKFEKVTLVADQVYGDCSVSAGGGSKESFEQIEKIIISSPLSQGFIIKIHPDVIVGGKKGYFSRGVFNLPNVLIISDPINPHSLFDLVDDVYVVTSQIGFEALLAEKPVVTFASPFYAGWGLTDDRSPDCSQNAKLSFDVLFAIVCIKQTTYVDHHTGSICSIEKILQSQADYLAKAARLAGIDTATVVGMSLWKRSFVSQFMSGYGVNVVHQKSMPDLSTLPKSERVIGWAGNFLESKIKSAPSDSLMLIEDGFIRSSGLGSDLRRPNSLAFDSSGIYFSPRPESDLSKFLFHHDFTVFELERAGRLIDTIRASAITKYNLRDEEVFEPSVHECKLILVVGQVPNDASVKFGSHKVKCNISLLREVRLSNNSAHIIYKPHPDVVSGNRDCGETREEALKFADSYAENVSINDLFESVDEVHTISSLAGFEALLRGVKVVCYGQPFYSGWGLTNDLNGVPIKRELQLDCLVYASLIWYPYYFSWRQNSSCSVEDVIVELSLKTSEPKHRPIRKMKYLIESVL